MLYLHLREPDRRLVHGRAFAAVAPGGTLLVVGHDRENLDRGYGGPTNPDVLLTPEAVVSDLPAEAVVERAERVERPVALETGAVVAIDTLVRARRSAGAD